MFNKKTVDKRTERVVHDLEIDVPGHHLPLSIRLIAYTLMIGGLSLLSNIFIDIIRPPEAVNSRYFLRIIMGFVGVLTAYGILTRKPWSLWLYGGICYVSFTTNPVLAILPTIIFIYLVIHRKYFYPPVPLTKWQQIKKILFKKNKKFRKQ